MTAAANGMTKLSPEVERILQDSLPYLNPPHPTTKVYKDECMFSYDTPETETGLYICLRTFWGLGADYLKKYVEKTGNTVFLHLRRIKHKKEKVIGRDDSEDSMVTRLAIGLEGGFKGTSVVDYEFEEKNSLVVFPGPISIPLPNEQLPEKMQGIIAGVLASESARLLAELEAMTNTWDGEARVISKHCLNLQQLQNGKKVPPKGWKCEGPGCDKVDNLWLNLTDGSILCGRKMFDGSGGNNHALEHYAEVKYPLAVKLGTITPDGKGDVFSYDEDDMVIDSKLVEHLAHFGINVATLEKTEKSMAELEIELNMKHLGEINALTESGKQLKPLRGPGITGIVNLGNSCYLNSTMQVLFNIPTFQERFMKNAQRYFEASGDPVNDFNVQMSKMCLGLLSGKYAIPMDPDDPRSDAQLGISPYSFKTLVGRNHQEFSTKKQQDAQEFFLHIINVLEKHSRHDGNPANCFKFKVEDKVQCDESKCVRYTHRVEYCLPLPIPLEAATNREEVKEYERKKKEAAEKKTTLTAEETVRYNIPLDACIEAFISRETLEGFHSSATKKLGTASKFTRLCTFPNFLVIQLKKFCMGEDWTPQKLDVQVDMPLELDLSALKSSGVVPGEVEFPEDPQNTPAPAPPKVDEGVVNQLIEMGFLPNACRRAVINTGNTGVENAMQWMMQHLDDPDINDPIKDEGGSGGSSTFVPNEEALVSIQSMGFTPEQAKKALMNTDNNVERAVDWIFSHMDELNDPSPCVASAATNTNANEMNPSGPAGGGAQDPTLTDGSPKYKLLGFVSHMGPSSMVGHYVAHIQKEDGTWILFNDNRVAASETLPKGLGYLYFYKRV